jgi:hypothetical protein
MDKIISWMENNGVTCYTIFSVGNEKRSERLCTDVNNAITEFAKDYEILPDGKYYVKGMTNPKGDRGAVRMDFQIGNIGTTNNSIGGMNLAEMKAEIYAQARKDFEYEQLDKRIKALEDKQKIIVAILVDLTDGDESNDEKATNMLSLISSAKENFETAKEALSGFKM